MPNSHIAPLTSHVSNATHSRSSVHGTPSFDPPEQNLEQSPFSVHSKPSLRHLVCRALLPHASVASQVRVMVPPFAQSGVVPVSACVTTTLGLQRSLKVAAPVDAGSIESVQPIVRSSGQNSRDGGVVSIVLNSAIVLADEPQELAVKVTVADSSPPHPMVTGTQDPLGQVIIGNCGIHDLPSLLPPEQTKIMVGPSDEKSLAHVGGMIFAFVANAPP